MSVLVKVAVIIFLLGILSFFSLLLCFFNRGTENRKKRNWFLIGLAVCFFGFCIALVCRGVGCVPVASDAAAIRVRIVLLGLLDVLAGMLFFRSIRLYDTEDPETREKIARSTQRIGLFIVLIGVALTLTNL